MRCCYPTAASQAYVVNKAPVFPGFCFFKRQPKQHLATFLYKTVQLRLMR
uniref:Uncharacterized protein n=1 Tax=Rheinheimera sp. BAL341 TaxID=1708203 RepID=A0A486XJ21_9GAMM